MNKVTQGALVLLAVFFLGLGGYYLFIAPEPKPATPEGSEPVLIAEGSETVIDDPTMGTTTTTGFEAIDLTNLDATQPITASGTVPSNVFDSAPGTGSGTTPAVTDTITNNATITAPGNAATLTTGTNGLTGTATTGNGIGSGTTATPNYQPTIVPPVPTAPAFTNYTVKEGDTLTSIAKHFYGPKGKWEAIQDANPGLNPSRLKIGATIKVPTLEGAPSAGTRSAQATATANTTSYTVGDGDTLSGISEKVYGSQKHWEAIYNANKATIGSNPAALKIGMKLTIPAKP